MLNTGAVLVSYWQFVLVDGQTGDAGELTALQQTFGATDRDMELLGAFYLSILSMTEDEVEALDGVAVFSEASGPRLLRN